MTSVVQGPEAVAEAHVATLKNHLATEIAWVWAAWNDGLPQPSFDALAILPYDIDGLQYNDPAIGVIPEQWDTEIDGTGQGWQVTAYHLRLMVYLISDTQASVQKMTMRALQAVQRMYLNQPNLDGSVAGYLGTTVQQGVLFEQFRRSGTALLRQVGGLHLVTRVGWTY